MKKNFFLGFKIIVLFCVFTFQSNSQSLMNVNLDLNPGGVIYDVAETPTCYIVVGDFTGIAGTSDFHNIAFLNKTDLTVNNYFSDPFRGTSFSIDGAIRTIAYKKISYTYLLFGNPTIGVDYNLFFGGDFTTINGTTHNGIVKYKYSNFNVVQNFNIQSWDPQLSSSSLTPIVKDIEVYGDTLFYAGDYSAINNFTLSSDERFGVTAIDILTGNDLGIFRKTSSCNSGTIPQGIYNINSIELTQNRLILAGLGNYGGVPLCLHNEQFFKFTYDGCYDELVFVFNSPCEPSTSVGTDLSIVNDSIFGFIKVKDYSGTPVSNVIFLTDTANYGAVSSMIINNHPIDESPSSTTKAYFGGNTTTSTSVFEQTSITSYKDIFYMTEQYTYTGSGFGLAYLTVSGTDSTGKIWSAQITSNFPDYDHEHIFVEDNILFISRNGTIGTNFNTIGTGLIAYCLEPEDAKPFSIVDSLICIGDTVNYEIPPVKYADGYLWQYSGTGVDLGADDFGNEDLNYDISNVNGNSINIEYLNGFTEGQLTVTPYSTCNGLTVGTAPVYSNTISVNIKSNPLPNAVATTDTTLNCIRDTVILSGYSDTLNTTYAWLNTFGQIGTIGSDTTVAKINFSNNIESFIFKVTDQLGCVNYDTVFVTLDTLKPNISLPPTPWVITCALPSIDLTGNSTTNNVSYSWSDGTNVVNNQTVTANVGTWNLTVTDNINGCTTTDGSIIETNFDQPNVTLINYPTYTPTTTVDILDCYNPSLTIVCSSDTANTVANWVDDNSGTNPIGDTKTISIGDTYYVEVENLTNGCKSNQPVVIGENFTQPTIAMPISNTLNCSRDTVVLDGSTISLDSTLVWNGPTYTNIQNPLVSNQLGWHYFTVTKADNGCSKTDSINVVFEPTIEVVTDNDTLICNKTDVTLNASYLGTLTNVNYTWNNGSNTATSIYNSDPDTIATVIVTADGGCIGYDTVRISIPNPPTITTQSFTPCDGGASGKIIVTPTNGLSPYTYAINSGTFQSASLFENLSIGTYTITVADSINCQYATTAEITDNGTLPEPLFIFSTYNVQADTVVLVDVSTPPADNIDWDFPFEITVLDDSNINSPVIILPDTGAFQITMNAHYGTCIMPVTKWIYSADYDTTLATNYNQNGIKSVELYPNPNSGVFTVEIEFYKRQLSVTTVQDMNGYSYYWQENNEDNLIVTHNIDLGSTIQPGTYVLKVASEYDSYYITFIVNQ